MKEDSETGKENRTTQTPMQILEDALETCKFGRFNVKLMFATSMAVLSFTSVTTTSSYILSSAECDLNMSIMQKGLLNAMPFFGQVGSALFTGFLTDAFGRKIFLVWGHLAIFLCTIFEGTSQTYWMLLFGKLLDGIFISLTFSGTAVMVSEFTHKGVRDRVMLVYSSFMSSSLIVCALMAWGLLPRPWDFIIVDGYFAFHSWNIYLFVSSIPSLIAALMYYHLPESPKFLLSLGRESEALEVVKRIYSENSGQEKDSFQIKSLNSAGTFVTPDKISMKKQLTNALYLSKELFEKPLIYKVILFSSTTFVCLLAYSSLRLWFPQISTIIENYQNKHGGETTQFCVMINGYTSELAANVSLAAENNIDNICVPKSTIQASTSKKAILASYITGPHLRFGPVNSYSARKACLLDSAVMYYYMEPALHSLLDTMTLHPSGDDTYTNGIILGFLSLCLIGISSTLVDLLGQKPLMFVLYIACAVCSSVLYWTSSSLQIALLVAATCAIMQCALSLQNNMLVRVVPTSVRTLALSLIIMVGRIGSLVGSVLFPVMLEGGCMVPFMTLSIIALSVAALVFFFPNPSKKNKAGDK